jgi:hypothetical protein
VFWLFASVVLILVVLHRGFRRVAFWLGGVAVVIAAVVIGSVLWHEKRQTGELAADEQKEFESGLKAEQEVQGNQRETTVEDILGPRPTFDSAGIIICPAGQQPAKDNATGKQSCYIPRDPAQLAAHLKECTSEPGDAPWSKDPITADRRNIPCGPRDQFENDCPAPPAVPWPGCISRDAKPWEKYQRQKQTPATPVEPVSG